MKMIKVKNDWSWAKNHTQQSMMRDKQLQENVLRVAIKNRIDVVNIIELYHEGLSLHQESTEGEAGKYLNFKSWFYEFFREEL